MSRLPRGLVPFLALAAALAACVPGLIAHPDGLIVDSRRSMVDQADPRPDRGVGNDLTFFHLPHYEAAVTRLAGGRSLPLWDPSGFGGRPLVGNPQAGLFYPPVWVAWAARRPAALGWLTLAHLLWAGLGVYVLLRALGASPLAAGTGGLCFELSPYLLSHVFEGHYPHVWAVSWYPWAFLGYLLFRRRDPGAFLWLPAALALAFLAGHPQEWYYLVVALSAWNLADAWSAARRGSVRQAGLIAGRWAAVVAASLSLCAVELLPQVATSGWHLRGVAESTRTAGRYFVHSLNLVQLLDPFALGGPADYSGHDNYWETQLGFGLIPLLLAVQGGMRHRDRAAVRGWLAVVGLGVVLACGRRLGLYSLALWVLPGLGRFRVPARTLFLVSLGLAVLAGLGADALRSRSDDAPAWASGRRRLRNVLLGLAAGLALVRLVGLVSGGIAGLGDAPRAFGAVQVVAGSFVLWAVLGALVVVACGRGRWFEEAGRASVVLAALGVLELVTHANRLMVVSPAEAFVAGGVATIDPGRDEAGAPLRVATVPNGLTDLDAVRAGVRKTDVNDSFQIQHAANLYQKLYPYLSEVERKQQAGREQAMDSAVREFRVTEARTILDRLSVGLVITRRPFPELGLTPAGTRVGARGERLFVSQNPTALPLAYVVPHGVAFPTKPRVPVTVRLGQVDPRAEVWVERDSLPEGARQPFTPARWVSEDPDRPVLAVETSAPGFLVIGSTWMPGWSATVDGRPEPVLRGNGWQQVVAIRGGGAHRVALSYDPPGYRTGLAVTLAVLSVWAVGMVALAVSRAGWVRVARSAWAWAVQVLADGKVTPSRSSCGATIPQPAVR